MIPDIEFQKLREIIIQKVEESDPYKTAELALSGGTDSVTILFAMLATGRKPRCYTFVCENTPSEDHASAKALCDHFGLEHVTVTIPWNKEQLMADLRICISRSHKIKKTIVQCLHPWLYLYPAMKSNTMLCGLGGDDHYCMQRKVQVKLHVHGEQAVRDAGWRAVMSKSLNFSVGNIVRLGTDYGKTLVDIYDDQRIEDWFMQWNIADLHKPMEKTPSVYAFKEFYEMGNFYRHHSSYQKNSKLQMMHESLLTPDLEAVGAKDVIKIYNMIAKGQM